MFGRVAVARALGILFILVGVAKVMIDQKINLISNSFGHETSHLQLYVTVNLVNLFLYLFICLFICLFTVQLLFLLQ